MEIRRDRVAIATALGDLRVQKPPGSLYWKVKIKLINKKILSTCLTYDWSYHCHLKILRILNINNDCLPIDIKIPFYLPNLKISRFWFICQFISQTTLSNFKTPKLEDSAGSLTDFYYDDITKSIKDFTRICDFWFTAESSATSCKGALYSFMGSHPPIQVIVYYRKITDSSCFHPRVRSLYPAPLYLNKKYEL